VKAYINGHNHKGNYAIKKGIHYITMKGMVVNTLPTYGIIQVHPKQLNIVGYGNEISRTLLIP
jgi:manganese-dependent ADP-ribose/CDP-alcohol diphosphatase